MVNMEIIITEDPATCCNCKNATVQIPRINRWSNPVCSKGHGVCREDKTCEDYVLVTAVCGRCKYIEATPKKLVRNLHNIPVHFAGKVCEDFEFDSFKRLSRSE